MSCRRSADRLPTPGRRAAIVACLLLFASLAGCLGSETDEASQGTDVSPQASDNATETGDRWKVVENETGTIENGAGSGWSYAAWNGDGGEPYRIHVEEGADRLSIQLSAPRVNTSSSGAGHVLMYVETAAGEYRVPDGATIVPVERLPSRDEPLVVTPTPPPAVQTIEVDDPEPGLWMVKIGPNGAAVDTTYRLTTVQEGGQ